MSSDYHATVRKARGLWVYRVFQKGAAGHPVMIARGSDRDWRTAFAQAAGTVSAFRTMYEYKYEDGR